MGNDILTGMLIGDALSRDYSNGGGARVLAEQRANDSDRHADNMELATVAAIEHVVSWRDRAMSLRSGVVSRKMSEALLLEALQQENPQHPLASREVIDRISDEAYDAQLNMWNADPVAYAQKTMNERPMIDEQALAALREKYLPAKPSHPATGGAGEEHESHGHDGAGMESAPKG